MANASSSIKNVTLEGAWKKLLLDAIEGRNEEEISSLYCVEYQDDCDNTNVMECLHCDK